MEGAFFKHAFFTRRGGASAPPFDTLHFGSDDSPEAARENVRRAADFLGVEPSRIFVASQVHGRTVCVLTGRENRDEVRQRQADAVVTQARNVACCVRVADCVPVLVADRATGAVAAIHSGWRGTVSNVVEAAVRTLREVLGNDGDLIAAIGPHIEACCFEVGRDVAAELARCCGGPQAVVPEGERARVDLRRIIETQLTQLGIGTAEIDHVHGCTVCDPARFFSFRRDRDRSGRMLAAIVGRGSTPS